MNKVNSASICCVNCGKGYKTRNGLDRHLVLCEIVHKIKSGAKVAEEVEVEIPSPKIMYQMILQLAEKYQRLEEKTSEMNKWVVKKKKKMDVVVWLNESVKPDYEFDKVADRVVIEEADVEFMLDNSLHETIYRVLFRVFVADDLVVVPVFAFNQKQGILYMYEKEKWTELPADRLTRLLNICQRKISKAMLDWKKKHKDEINASDAFATRYDKAVLRLMSIEFRENGQTNKAKNVLYNRLKTDAKTVIEYEFE
jgi:hypothetical protein